MHQGITIMNNSSNIYDTQKCTVTHASCVKSASRYMFIIVGVSRSAFKDSRPFVVLSGSVHTHTFTCLTALFPGLPRWAGTRKLKPMWILLKQEIVSGSGISLAICKSARRSRQPRQHPTTQFFYRPDALPAAQPTASKHWRHLNIWTADLNNISKINYCINNNKKSKAG